MRNCQSFVRVLILVLFAALVGCATPQHREAGLAQTAPKMTRDSDEGYYAVCTYETAGGHNGPWIGPLRTSKQQAITDASEHDRLYPGHHATVVHY